MAAFLVFISAACQAQETGGDETGAEPALPSTPQAGQGPEAGESARSTAATPRVDLTLTEADLSVAPLPLRAGFPFTVTATLHNNGDAPAVNVPVLVHISALQERIGYAPFTQVLTVTLPTTRPVSMEIPIRWNLAGGEHKLWIQVNRLPEVWWPRWPLQPETDRSDNSGLLELMVDPFDAYTSDLCPGRVDVGIDGAVGQVGPDQSTIAIRVRNVGNQAVYNLPVVATGDRISGIAYTPAIPPCGGTAVVSVQLDRPVVPGETLAVQLNPEGWDDGLAEDNYSNNLLSALVDLESTGPPGAAPVDYDFSITTADIETPEPWIVMVTVRNLGTRDASAVPIRVENESGRTINDSIPLVRGEGIGQAAVRVGYLWTHGGTLSFTVNPQDAKGAYPERDRTNNVAEFILP